MKMLWLSAVTATCVLFGSMAHAGDHHHRGERYERHCDDWRPRHDWGRREVYYRPVHYRPAEVYYRPVHYRPAAVVPVVPAVPVAYEPMPVYGGGRVHGSITVGF